MLALMLAAPFALSACDPAQVGGDLTDRAARSVVVHVLVNQYPRPQAETATTCVLRNGSADEVERLARDFGTRAGTGTVATIRAIGDRPATRACLSDRGLALIAVVP
jgi:hypothetical protein